jgi:dihydroorotate dehydrogenase
LGGVTWLEQPGNPRPRIFRGVADEALVNRMGFNNPGAEKMAATLEDWKRMGCWPKHPVGINLGKSKDTPLENAPADYANSFRRLWSLADFFVVNVSSPNTPNLRQLQDKAALDEILSELQRINVELTQPSPGKKRPEPLKPIWVKVAPDLSFDALDEVIEIVQDLRIAGLVATNTTITRPATQYSDLQTVYAETGGLSGRPLRNLSTGIIRHIHRQTGGAVPIIGVGGIFNAADAWEKITAGASLIQIYTGLIYEGPSIAQQIVTGLLERMEQFGLRTLPEAVGFDMQLRAKNRAAVLQPA